MRRVFLEAVILLLFLFSFFNFTSVATAYEQEFADSSYLSDSRWTVNHNSGSVALIGNSLQLSAGGVRQFPYITIDYSGELIGDYTAEISFKYRTGGITQGSGIVFSDRILVNGQMDSNNYKGVWLWPSASSNIHVASNLCSGAEICSTVVHETINNTSSIFHTLKIERIGSVYKIIIDNSREYDLSSSRELKYLWLGNPEVTGSNQVWPLFEIDYIRINSTEENGLSVPDLKQYDPEWGQEVYDHALRWSPGSPTIERWGCALTSAAMVLNYYNTAINPDELNDWLVGQSDGYIRNGLINWLAISRFAKLHKDADSPNLEYSRASFNNDVLDSALDNDKPVILGEPGHFIVAKGKSGNTYSINDPGYSNRPTLASYGNSYLSQGIYTPSNTDLSYIMLAADGNVDIKVRNSDGDLVGESFLEQLNDLEDADSTNEELNVYYLPKPALGTYDVEISGGDGTYQLDAYLYDTDGEVVIESFKGILGDGESEQFKVSVGEANDTSKDYDIDQLLADLEELKQRGLIQDPAYKMLKNQLESLKKTWDKTPGFVRDIKIGVITKGVNLLSPRYMSVEAEEILIEGLNNLNN